MSRRVRVLIVDDSPTIRALLHATLGEDPEIEVVGEAGDPIEAREAIKTLNPDVLTLDVEMPNMNGLEFLERLMRLRPMPVVMVSTLTHQGADAALEALELGAVDCIGKPGSSGVGGFSELAAKVKIAAGARIQPRAPAAPAAPPSAYAPSDRIVALGASTGGVEALLRVVSTFPANCPPTVITQHMPASFTANFAARLDRHCAARVTLATDGAELRQGQIYLAPGGQHLRVGGRGPLRCKLDSSDPVNGHRPSVDVLFQSVADAVGPRAVGVILTGMGRDGAAGLLAMRRAGAATLGQDEATSVVFGMPKAAADIGAVERQLPLYRLAQAALDAAAANLQSGAA